MKIALAQLSASRNKQENLDKALLYIKQAKEQNADLIVFPEVYMALLGPKSGIVYADMAEPLDGPFVTTLAKAASENGIHIICGIFEKSNNDDIRAYNTIIFLDDNGELIHSYRKTHLYDAFSYQESANIIAGENGFEPVKTRFGTIGLLVCYELRFPEISRTLALKGADILIVPTAWVSGPMKEEHLLSISKARALENTVYMCVADQVGNIYSGRSVIYNPMGTVLASCGEDEGLIFADIDLEKVKTTREKLPCLDQRRPELYRLG